MSDPYKLLVSPTRFEPLGAGQFRLDLQVEGTELASSFVSAGQYVRVSLTPDEAADDPHSKPEEPARAAELYLALCSAPSDGGAWTLLLKEGGHAVDQIVACAQKLASPTELQLLCSRAEGKGFGIEAASGGDLLLFAGGSGISAIRSVLRACIASPGKFSRIVLFHGVRHPEAFAFHAEEAEDWRAAGVELVPVISAAHEAWEGARGYVQDHLEALKLSYPSSWACLCGPRDFQDDIRARLIELGLPSDHVLTNF